MKRKKKMAHRKRQRNFLSRLFSPFLSFVHDQDEANKKQRDPMRKRNLKGRSWLCEPFFFFFFFFLENFFKKGAE